METRNLVSRCDLKAFFGVAGEAGTVFTRMRGFTTMSESKNPKEYTRHYVDERHETTDVVGYSPSHSFNFDKYKGDAILEDIVSIIDNETVGTEAHREIIQVDFSKPVGDGFEARKRVFAVIGDSVGDTTDALTYSGNFKPVGSVVTGVATIEAPANGTPDTVETITFAEGADQE